MAESNVFPNIELFHVHIPKTAGTSLNFSLEQAYGDAFANHDPERMRTDSSIRAAAAHTTLRSAKALFPNAKLVTVLRDPVSRFKSTLRHLYARRNWPNYAEIGTVIDELIDAKGNVQPTAELTQNPQFVERFDNLMVRYLTTDATSDRVSESNLQTAKDALPDFFQVLHQDNFSEGVAQLFELLGFSHVVPTKTNQAKSQIPLWKTIPEEFEQFLASDIALYKEAVS